MEKWWWGEKKKKREKARREEGKKCSEDNYWWEWWAGFLLLCLAFWLARLFGLMICEWALFDAFGSSIKFFTLFSSSWLVIIDGQSTLSRRRRAPRRLLHLYSNYPPSLCPIDPKAKKQRSNDENDVEKNMRAEKKQRRRGKKVDDFLFELLIVKGLILLYGSDKARS